MKVSACIIEGVSDGQTVSNGSLFKEFEYFLDVVVLQLYHT